MDNSRVAADPVSGYVAEIAAQLHGRLADISAGIQRSLEDHIPELRADARAVELGRASITGNLATVIDTLRHDIVVDRVEAPTAALEYARRLAQHGVALNVLLRAYRLGQRWMNELVFAEARAISIPEPLRADVIEAITATMFEYTDWMSQQIVAAYEGERERWLEDQNSLRAVRVQEILAAETPVDVDAATTAIRYPLRRHHVAVIMWCREADTEVPARLQRFLRDLGAAADTAEAPLFVAADARCGWGWLPYPEASGDAVAAIRRFTAARPDAPNVAIGTMAGGLDGFRQSHRDAENAHRVAVLATRPAATVIAADDPGVPIAALLAADLAGTRRWVIRVLGDLAADTDNDLRLRETLRVFLRAGSSHKAAAGTLNLHYNSVKYRVARAIARRGRGIADDRLDVELALLACYWYGPAVLRPQPR